MAEAHVVVRKQQPKPARSISITRSRPSSTGMAFAINELLVPGRSSRSEDVREND